MNAVENIIAPKNDVEKPIKLSNTGKVLIGLTGGVAVALSVICAPFVSPALRKHCLPYIPATNEQVKNIFAALRNRSGSLVDLGSGDGRIVIDAAKNGFDAVGVELNYWLVLYSRFDALKSRVRNVKFVRRDLWKCDLGKYDNVVIFGVEQMMNDLEKKFLAECRKDCVVVACRFPLPNTTPLRAIGTGIDTVWLYEIGKTN